MSTKSEACPSSTVLLPIRSFLFTLFIVCFVASARAQTYYFDTYGTSDGISSVIRYILQDHQHTVWLATSEGVARFDGDKFENFNKEDGLASGGVKCMMLDADNTLWFGHLGGGISIYRNGQFSVFPYLDTLIHGDVTSIFRDRDQRIWITTYNSGAFRLEDPENDPSHFSHYIGRDKLSDIVFGHCLTAENEIFFITDAGVRKYNETANQFEIFHPEGFANYFSITTMLEDRESNLWFGTYNGGLYKYEPASDTVLWYDKRDGLSKNVISSLLEDSNGNIWIGTWGGGITRLGPEGFTIFDQSNGLEAKEIRCLVEDVEGNILIGSSYHGFCIYKGDLIENYGVKEGLHNTDVYAIIQDAKKSFWIGTNQGISILRYDTENTLKKNAELRTGPGFYGTITEPAVRFLKTDVSGGIWIGTESNRVLYFDPYSRQVRDAFQINRAFSRSDYRVTAMDIDQNNKLWVGTSDGLLNYNMNTGEVQRLSTEVPLIGNAITAVYCDPDNQVWVGAMLKPGMSKIVDGTSIINYPYSAALTPTCMVMDKKKQLWIGAQQGLFHIVGDSIEENQKIKGDLLSPLINTLNVDENNTLYIGTNRGLNVYDQKNDRIKAYNQKNGYLGIETNPSASYYNAEKMTIWFGTNEGINQYNIDQTKSQPVEPLVYLTDLRINQLERDIESGLRLHSFENQITISYKSICLTNSDAVRYRVMLEGLDNEWQEATSNTTITYQSLPPDKYTFRVIARNSEGIWSNEPAILAFSISTPLYKRWYFIISVVLAILIVFWLYVKIRERNLIREKRILEEKVRDRTQQLEEANLELEDKNKNITDSIRYALRIQMSILPPEIPFPNMFVLFKPKDIVSGDFYWLASEMKKEIIAAVDCTGHGVPGAFMSFIGYSSLNEVVKEKKITQPSRILDALNETVVSALNLQGAEAIKDGMDLALISYDTQTKELEYAGAYNPLYLIRNGELQEVKADRFAIGKSSERVKKFTNHSLPIENGDTVYLFSDGFADQFGGENDKKFKASRVRELLLNIQDKSMDQQKRILDKTIEEWRGKNEQVDDMLFIGRRF